MTLFEILSKRAGAKCELCSGEDSLSAFPVLPTEKIEEKSSLLLCKTCLEQVEDRSTIEQNHWRCLNESMWSEYAPVQVMAFRMLTALKHEAWARELLEQLYLDEATLEWARAGIPEETKIDLEAPTLDSNGTRLTEGDSVTLIKDLEVKGAGFTAKRGTLVKNITLTTNPKHIEGRVNGIQIVLIAAYLKKA